MALFSRRPLVFRAAFSLALPILFGVLCATSSLAQTQPDAATKRRLVEHSAAAYPNLARTMALQGIVRIEAVVSPDGSVKAVTVKGGHPVLAQAAVSAVRQWKWERAPRESLEPIEVRFERQ